MTPTDRHLDRLPFSEITFAIPAQKFGVTCAVSTEETLPVVTEFAIRLVYIASRLTPAQLQQFFGFSEAACLYRRRRIAPPEEVAPLAAHRLNVDVLPRLRSQKSRCRFDDVGIERASQTFIASHHNQENIFLFPLRQ